MKIKRGMLYASVLSFLGLTVAVQFNACSDVAFEPSQSESLKTGDASPEIPPPTTNPPTTPPPVLPPPPPTSPPIDVVRATCANSTPLIHRQSVEFADPNQVCPFGQGDNDAKRDLYHSARIERSVPIAIPSGAVICDMDFQFATQAFWYDDFFAFTLDGFILAASHDFEAYGLPQSNGLPKWDWSRIRGKRWASSNSVVKCASVLGENGSVHNGSCSFPQTDTNGEIRLDFPSEVFYQVVDGVDGVHSFGFMVTGDNDERKNDGSPRDCRHSSINFNIEVKYVVPGE